MGKYDFQMDLDDCSTTGKHVKKIAPGSVVLEFGCAEGRMTRYMKEILKCKVYIIEMDKQSFDKAMLYAEGGICCDAETLVWKDELKPVRFDYIIFSDVLEHLRRPDVVMRATIDLLKENGHVLVSIPNIGHGDIICSLLCNNFHYTDVGLLDNTHVHFWGHTDFLDFAKECGYSVIEEDAIYLGINASEQAQYSVSLPNGIRNEIASFPYSGVYEFVFVLQKNEYVEKMKLGMVSHIKTESQRAFDMLGHLYMDTGDGYSENQVITITVKPDGYYSQRVKLPPHCHSVRFDPMEGTTGCVWNVLACTPNKSLAIQYTNGYQFGRTILYQTVDPQIEFEPLEPDAPWIEIHALVWQFDGPAWVELCERIIEQEKETLRLTEELKNSGEEHAITVKNLEIIQGKLRREEGERIAVTQVRDDLLQERENLAHSYSSIVKERDELADAYNILIHEQDNLAQTYNGLVKERDELTKAYNDVLQERENLTHSYSSIVKERDEQADAYNNLLHEQDNLAQAYNGLVKERDELTRAYNDVLQKWEVLVEKNNCMAQEKNKITKSYNSLKELCNDLEQKIQRVESQRDALQAELATVTSERQKERSESAKILDDQKEHCIDLINQLNDLSLRMSNLQESYNAISDAQLWKMTGPVRHLLDAIKRTRVGDLSHKAARIWRVYGFKSMVRRTISFIKKSKGLVSIIPETSDQTPSVSSISLKDAEYSFEKFLLECQTQGQIYGRDHLEDIADHDRVLLVSHEMSLTGAPIALLYFANYLKRRGMAPIFCAPCDGNLRERACSEGIPVVILKDVYQGDLLVKALSFFKTVVISTIVGAPLVRRMSGMTIPVVWWIHEAKASYHSGALDAMPDTVGENIHVYCGGEYAKKILAIHRPAYQTDILLYTSPDYANMTSQGRKFHLSGGEHRTIFMLVGTLEERKGQDVLVEAIRHLDARKRENSYFVFVGRPYYKPIHRAIIEICKTYPNAVEYIEEVSQEELPSLYECADCVICTSLDDPMPIVMADAMSLSKVIICSENSGTASLIEGMSAGLIYHNNDPQELVCCIETVLKKENDLERLRSQARKTYEKFFSKNAFERNFERIMINLLSEPEILPGKISVVIPTYNGGADLKRLLEMLDKQEGIQEIEIIVVDSGSNDHSDEYAESIGAKVIRIPQSDFSHSYARNLGAEHATGEYLLFMTQDAYPNGVFWVRGMLKPVINQDVVAVSCRELPREGCDLLGRVSIYNHSLYMGILANDRILQMPRQMDNDSLRKNGQLNDVSCLVRRDIFERYYYRYDYAEDLDLGLRLIRDGNKLALLSTVQVIHSHTRSSMYHFKRGIVDVSTINHVLPGSVGGTCSAQYAIDRILTAYCVSKLYVRAVADYLLEGNGEEAWNAFCRWTSNTLNDGLCRIRDMDANDRKSLIIAEDALFDVNYQKAMLEILEISNGVFEVEPTTVNEMKSYLVDVLGRFFTFEHVQFTEKVKEEICVLAEKLTGLMAGNLMGTYATLHEDDESKLGLFVKKYRQGV